MPSSTACPTPAPRPPTPTYGCSPAAPTATTVLAVTRSEDQTSLTMPTIKGHSSRRILVVARRESRSVLLAALRGLHLDSLLGDDRRRLDRGMDVCALSDALVCIRSDEQQIVHVSQGFEFL